MIVVARLVVLDGSRLPARRKVDFTAKCASLITGAAQAADWPNMAEAGLPAPAQCCRQPLAHLDGEAQQGPVTQIVTHPGQGRFIGEAGYLVVELRSGALISRGIEELLGLGQQVQKPLNRLVLNVPLGQPDGTGHRMVVQPLGPAGGVIFHGQVGAPRRIRSISPAW